MILDFIFLFLALISFVGQVLSFFAPDTATKLGVNDDPSTVEKAHYIIESKAEGLSDLLLLWILPVGILLKILQFEYFYIFTMIGGSIFLYFSLLIIFTRVFLKSNGLKYGTKSSVINAYIFGLIWFLIGLYYIILAIGVLV